FWISKIPTVVGSTWFGIGIYMGYLELINMDVDLSKERANLLWCDWQALYTVLREDKSEKDEGGQPTSSTENDDDSSCCDVYWYQPLSSILGWVIYLVGAILYEVANLADAFTLSQ
ncbi:GIP, partial [Symbiodinium pilosum]